MNVLEGLDDAEDRRFHAPRRQKTRVERLGRETRDSLALVLLTLAVVVTVSFVGLALA